MDAGLPVALVNPRRTRDSARAIGWMAKNDRIDARLLAEYGRRAGPTPAQRVPEGRAVLDTAAPGLGTRQRAASRRYAPYTLMSLIATGPPAVDGWVNRIRT